MSEIPSVESDEPMSEAEFAALVEGTMYEEGWVCNPADHEGIPAPGECINCDAERHRFGYRLYARAFPPGEGP